MTAIKIGYARVSTDGQDLTAQRQALAALGVPPDRIYVDHGITGTHRQRPGLREALAACRPGSGVGNLSGVEASADSWHGQPASASLRVPPLGTVWLHSPGPGA